MSDPPPIGVSVVEGDITEVAADAIVNAANSMLAVGGGVCGAIFRAAGSEQLAAACRAIGQCPVGSAVATPAFEIKTAKHIIHAVGPRYRDHAPADAQRLLQSAYASAIRLAGELGCTSLAIPALSTGIYGYPLEEACRVAAATCAREGRSAGVNVILVAFDGTTAQCLREALA